MFICALGIGLADEFFEATEGGRAAVRSSDEEALIYS
jgi:hypothetical protein